MGLDAGGSIPVISNEVPESVSYSGRFHIELAVPGMDESWFKPVPPPGDSPRIGRTVAVRPRMLPLADDLLRAATTSPTGESTPIARLLSGITGMSGAQVTPSLAALTPADIRTANAAGQRIQFYRTPLTNKLAYRMISRDPRPDDPPPTNDPADKVNIVVNIQLPMDRQILKGPSTGVNVRIRGTARVTEETDIIDAVEVSVGLDPPQAATFTPGTDVTWSLTKNLTQSGSYGVVVKVKSNRKGIERTDRINFNLELAPALPVPVQIGISSPAPGSVVAGPAGAIVVKLEGTTMPPAGKQVAGVSVLIDKDGPAQTAATPVAAGDWSSWTAQVTVTSEGPHRLTVRANDSDNNTTDATIDLELRAEPVFTPTAPRLFLVEMCGMTSFLGNYGAGKVVKTFSLYPGEKTRISMRTFTRSAETRKESSSILDSLNEDSEKDFTESLDTERTAQSNSADNISFGASVTGSASWGVASASISASVNGGSNSARAELAKSVTNATNKHVQKVSATREIQLNSEYEVTTESGEETSIERVLENVNLSRTLNFVFRQMNQEYITLLHLTDVRVAYIQGIIEEAGERKPALYLEVSLAQLPSLLGDFVVDDTKRGEILNAIRNQLSRVWDYEDKPLQAYEEVAPGGMVGDSYLRFPKTMRSTFASDSGFNCTVRGIILSALVSVARTEGVIAEAVLGSGDALDTYSESLQQEAVRAKRAENRMAEAMADTRELANEILRRGDETGAAVFAKLFPCCPDVSLAVAGAAPRAPGDGKGPKEQYPPGGSGPAAGNRS